MTITTFYLQRDKIQRDLKNKNQNTNFLIESKYFELYFGYDFIVIYSTDKTDKSLITMKRRRKLLIGLIYVWY